MRGTETHKKLSDRSPKELMSNATGKFHPVPGVFIQVLTSTFMRSSTLTRSSRNCQIEAEMRYPNTPFRKAPLYGLKSTASNGGVNEIVLIINKTFSR